MTITSFIARPDQRCIVLANAMVLFLVVAITLSGFATVGNLSVLIVAVVVGLFSGWIIAHVEVPAIIATLATGTVVFGAMQYFAVSDDIMCAAVH